jgi:peptidoglycan-associated lipoprotein
MSFKNIAKYSLIALAILSLTACQTLKGHKSASNENAPIIDTAQDTDASASGAGTSSRFSDDESASAHAGSNLQVGEQTYYFDFDRSDIHEADRASIEVQGRYLAQHSTAKVLLEGHTDPRGSREYNIALGQRRADSVANTLKVLGAAGSRQIRAVSYGAEKALAGSAEQDYQLDRRVHLGYEDKG